MNVHGFKEILDLYEEMTPEEFDEEFGEDVRRLIQNAKKGRMVIRIIEGGNEYLKVGDSVSGTTRAFSERLPLVIEYPNGHYQSTGIERIDWQAGTFKTLCSVYHFHFLDE